MQKIKKMKAWAIINLNGGLGEWDMSGSGIRILLTKKGAEEEAITRNYKAVRCEITYRLSNTTKKEKQTMLSTIALRKNNHKKRSIQSSISASKEKIKRSKYL